MLAIIKIIFLLGFLVIIHETGHYIVAKLCKIRVNEFAIGFGPKIWSYKGKETTYELRLIPLGGFVRLEGEEEQSNKEGSFNKSSIPKRIAVVAAGAIVNIVFGLLLYGILIGARFMAVNSSGIIEGVQYAFKAIGELIQSLAIGITQIFSGKISMNDMMGPIGISEMVTKTSGIVEFIYLLSIISVSLGVTNLLPIIPLDGGKIVLLIIEAIRKKPLSEKLELKVQSIGFLILIIFSVAIAVNDVSRLL